MSENDSDRIKRLENLVESLTEVVAVLMICGRCPVYSLAGDTFKNSIEAAHNDRYLNLIMAIETLKP